MTSGERNAEKRKYIIRLVKDGTMKKLAEGADSEKELYEALGVSKTTWFTYKKEIPELSELLIRTRYETFLQIKSAMKKRAMGYDYEEIEQEMTVNPRTGEQNKGKVRKTTRHVPPDLSSQRLLLKNIKNSECRKGKPVTELSLWSNSMDDSTVQESSSGRFEQLEGALKELFFGDGPEGVKDGGSGDER